MRDAAFEFIRTAGWDAAAMTPVTSDLSARRYMRLTKGDQSAVLMDAGSDRASTEAFQAMTGWLQEIGLSVPTILAAQARDGLLLLEDLGVTPVSQVVADRKSAKEIYENCVTLLLNIRSQAPPSLSCPSARALCEWTSLADAFYPGADSHLLDRIRAGLETVLTECLADPASVSLRDFHVDNMMWLPNRDGVRRLGLLDYQDAFLTHPVYDLVSLLTDARTDVPRDLRQSLVRRYSESANDDPAALERAFAAFSLQRNLRILGIFHRSAEVDGKSHHLSKVPRVYGYLSEALEHPCFASIQPLLGGALPPPEGAS